MEKYLNHRSDVPCSIFVSIFMLPESAPGSDADLVDLAFLEN